MERIGYRLGQILGRSLIPLLALVIILGTIWWGPWVTLLLAAVLWVSVGQLV